MAIEPEDIIELLLSAETRRRCTKRAVAAVWQMLRIKERI